MNNRQAFKDFCEKEKDIPLFLSYGWLNTVAPDSWNIAIEKKDGEIIGILPYVIKTKSGFKLIELPPLTAMGGIWIKYPIEQKYSSLLSYEKKIVTNLIEQLPPFDRFVQKFHPSITNWLPFYWKGFKQHTAYTYIIEDISTPGKIFSEFKNNLRWDINKAEKNISVYVSDNIEILYQLKLNSYKHKNIRFSFNLDYLKKIHSFCLEKNCGELLVAKDEKGNIHSAALFVFDQQTCHYLFAASAPEHKNSGSMSLLLWKAIEKYSSITQKFNFEGSMIEDIERYFRSFGAKQTPYFVIKKTNSKILKLKTFLKEF